MDERGRRAGDARLRGTRREEASRATGANARVNGRTARAVVVVVRSGAWRLCLISSRTRVRRRVSVWWITRARVGAAAAADAADAGRWTGRRTVESVRRSNRNRSNPDEAARDLGVGPSANGIVKSGAVSEKVAAMERVGVQQTATAGALQRVGGHSSGLGSRGTDCVPGDYQAISRARQRRAGRLGVVRFRALV